MASSDRHLCEELDDPSSYDELKTIISKVNPESPACDILFKGRYQVLFLENLLPWQKSIGQFFQNVIAICGVKPKKTSAVSDETVEEVFDDDEEEEDDGRPLPVVFDSLISDNSSSSSVPVIRHLKEKFHLYPLSQVVGRKILTLCNFISDEYRIPYPVIVMCYAKTGKAACIQGSMKNDKFVRVVVNTQGLVTRLDQLPKLSYVKINHISNFVPSCTIETSVYARYDILFFENCSELLPCKDMNVIMECYWSNPTAILEPVSTDCTCYAKIKAVAGDEGTGASEKFKELQLVMALFQSLETGVMNRPKFCSGKNVFEEVQDFIRAETREATAKRQKMMPLVYDLEMFDSIVKGNRTNLDFTEKLWLILKDFSSIEELKQALTYIFEALSGVMDPPFVHPKNNSKIARNIKSLQEKSVLWPTVTSHLACEMLLEIGIEKLRRDYETLFVGLELVPSNSLKYFLVSELNSLDAVTSLQKLHSTLELAVIGLKCLCLSKELLGDFIRNVLKYYTCAANVVIGHIFKFKIPSSKARYILDQMRPTIWEISLLSSDKDFKKQTVLHYSTTPTSEHVYAPKDYHPKLMLKKASYVFMTGTLIEDSFFVR